MKSTTTSSKKQKTTTPIIFPHDGPIYSHWSQGLRNNGDQQKDENGDAVRRTESLSFSPPSSESFSIRQAVWLLCRAERECENNDKNNDYNDNRMMSRLEQRCVKLCRDLQGFCDNNTSATETKRAGDNRFTTKEQLQYLQAFKCWLLENMATTKATTKTTARKRSKDKTKPITGEQNHDSSNPDDCVLSNEPGNVNGTAETDRNEDTRVLTEGLYRLLLEWLLSCKTPLPFQRAIQSNLNTILDLKDGDDDTSDRINREVILSIWNSSTTSSCCWNDTIHSLDVAVNFQPLLAVIQSDQQIWYGCLNFLYNRFLSLQQQQKQRDTLETALRIMNMTKLVLESGRSISDDSADPILLLIREHGERVTLRDFSGLLSNLQTSVLVLLETPNMLTEGFNSLGIVYGRLAFLLSFCSAEDERHPDSPVDNIVESTLVSARNRTAEICFVTLSDLTEVGEVTNDHSSTTNQSRLPLLARLSIVQGLVAMMDMETMMALPSKFKGNDQQTNPSMLLFHSCWKYTLHAGTTSTDPLVRWASIKGLSTLTARLKQRRLQNVHEKSSVRTKNHDEEQEMTLINDTLQFVFDSWENPPLRKVGTAIPGLFRSIVQVVPESYVPDICRTVFSQSVNRKGRYVALECLLPYLSFVPGGVLVVANGQTSPFDIESLLDGIGDRGPNSVAIANLWVKILSQMFDQVQAKVDSNDLQTELHRSVVEEWFTLWMSSFCSAVIGPVLCRRKQVMTYCLPRVVELMRENKKLKIWSSFMIGTCIEKISRTEKESSQAALEGEESLADRILWAQLELLRLSSTMKISGCDHETPIARFMPEQEFNNALAHHIPSIRLSALRSIKSVVQIYNRDLSSQNDMLKAEVSLWKTAIIFSLRAEDSKEYQSHLLQSLSVFMDRLSSNEAATASTNVNQPIFKSFVIEFLVGKMIVSQTAYPGTATDKESIAIALIDCLLAFVIQDERFSENNSLAQNGTIFIRTRNEIERAAMHDVLSALVSQEVISVLMGLIHSVWDTTRESASAVLSKLVVASRHFSLGLPDRFTAQTERHFLLARGVHLVSSPRQREADTGARLLLFLYASAPSHSNRRSFLSVLLQIASQRVSSMNFLLDEIISKSDDQKRTEDSSGLIFPLAYGLIYAIRLCIDYDLIARKLGQRFDEDTHDGLLDEIIYVCTQALKLSLSVVSDVNDTETDRTSTTYDRDKDSTPLNVNTGAIGANCTFSGVESADQNESQALLAVQRVVVGTWLMTKEATATLATVLSLPTYAATFDQVSSVGFLLLNTLTTLKHAGAAFAARDALQEIAVAVYSLSTERNVADLPSQWSKFLMDEISLNERVRNSTLRRSTGYALGFVALLRAESKTTNHRSIGTTVLSQLVKMSLPPEKRISAELKRLELQGIDSFDFYFRSSVGERPFVLDTEYEERCRVHALNVLRLIILDAPLAALVRPFVGDAIISAALGYRDHAWSIRNSSTMVFSSAMSRVVDTDKNASNSDKTSSNAISISELFRRYPTLSLFLPKALKACVIKMENDGSVESQLFPILLLLSRVQPVEKCNDSSIEISSQYHSTLLRCLGSKDSSIREVAARSVAVLCSSESKERMITELDFMLKAAGVTSVASDHHYNQIDGCLLALEELSPSNSGGGCPGVSCDDESEQRLRLMSSLRFIIESPRFPPSCRATSIRILSGWERHYGTKNRQFLQDLITHPSNEFENGHTILQSQLGYTLCHAHENLLWKASDEHQLVEALESLHGLFSSDAIDVRLSSIKAFKKGLPEKLHRFMTTRGQMAVNVSSDQSVSCEEVCGKLAAMLIDCLCVESNRRCRLGAHPPTLRRMSRCFLDVVDTCSESALREYLMPQNGLLWTISNQIAKAFGGLERSEPDTSTSLAANAAEMMALHIFIEDLNGRGMVPTEHIERMLTIVEKLNVPLSSWHSRYSAATALGRCHSIWSEPSDDRSSASLHHRALVNILQMLQDSDPDVQRAAVQAAMKYINTTMVGGPSGKSSLSLPSAPPNGALSFLPEWTLKRFFPLVFNLSDVRTISRTLDDLVAAVFYSCKDILDVIRTLQLELNDSSSVSICVKASAQANVDRLGQLMNTNSTCRAIFEIEDPNPNFERLLLAQLAARAILDRKAALDGSLSASISSSSTICHDLLLLCSKTLDLLKGQLNVGGMAHEISRFPSVFPSLHGLLCFTAALFFYRSAFSDTEGNTVYSSSSAIISQIIESATVILRDGLYVHPEIITTLRCIAGQEPFNTGQKMTFLL